ncbi:hypothetical protein L211DRAFT_848878 [Terfezia boudieri ATCC MYA-4762]|uniref:Uncharacterized protein n=1 Tax=Terfezia boudieri ATCC MYA-4762 TaxID=1051890 RepID=A0A3N4LVA1_9PEZI|nr:hypothetical protein L211DRAFT_848878 [Terfezia boudieri ATCC MYA-4762]
MNSYLAGRNRTIKEKYAEKRRKVAAKRLAVVTNVARPAAPTPSPQDPPQSSPQAHHPWPVRSISVLVMPRAPPITPPPQPQIIMPPPAPRPAKPTQEAPTIATVPGKFGMSPLAVRLDADGDIVMDDAYGDGSHLLEIYNTKFSETFGHVASAVGASGGVYYPPASPIAMMSVEIPPIGLGEIDMNGCWK